MSFVGLVMVLYGVFEDQPIAVITGTVILLSNCG